MLERAFFPVSFVLVDVLYVVMIVGGGEMHFIHWAAFSLQFEVSSSLFRPLIPAFPPFG